MEIEIVTKKSKSSNTFSVYIVYPTRGLDISFNYEGVKFQICKRGQLLCREAAVSGGHPETGKIHQAANQRR